MAQIGFHASHEQFAPSELLRFVQSAEQHGFRAGMCSDHFHPWSEHRGQSGFAWSWLGAALQTTQMTFGTVCAPGQRYHPAIIAQAAATLAEMFPGRFWLSIGSGEALNENITGDPWPSHDERNARLKECADIMRALWRGETVNHRGLVQVRDARLYTLPAEPPLLVGAALSPATAKWMGSWVDALITVGKETESLQQNIDAFREGGGEGKPMLLQAAVSYAPTEEQAVQEAFECWPHCTLESKQLSDLTTPEAFDAATRSSCPDDVRESLRVSADLEKHIEWLRRDIALGFETVYLHHVGRNIPQFLETFSRDVIPHVIG